MTSPFAVGVVLGPVGSLATLASMVSAPYRRVRKPRLSLKEMYRAQLTGGNTERVLGGCTLVIALVAQDSELTPPRASQRLEVPFANIDGRFLEAVDRHLRHRVVENLALIVSLGDEAIARAHEVHRPDLAVASS